MPVVETTTMLSTGSPEHLLGCCFEEIERGSQVDAVALGPAMRAVVPFDRYAGISPEYSGVQKYRQQAIKIRRAPEQELDAFDDVALIEQKGRNRGRDGEETREGKHRR